MFSHREARTSEDGALGGCPPRKNFIAAVIAAFRRK
jgi:coenzyme F420-reducing hydrogenase gamma subunit